MRFSELAHYLERLEATASRNDMTKILAEVYAKAGHDETDKLSYLLLGELTPSYRGVDFQIAEKMMIQILASAYEMSAARVLNQFRRKGDLGDLAYELAESAGKNSSSLNVEDVYDRLRALDRTSAKYVARIPVGKMRLGFSEATILDALSLMLKGDKSARPAIEL